MKTVRSYQRWRGASTTGAKHSTTALTTPSSARARQTWTRCGPDSKEADRPSMDTPATRRSVGETWRTPTSRARKIPSVSGMPWTTGGKNTAVPSGASSGWVGRANRHRQSLEGKRYDRRSPRPHGGVVLRRLASSARRGPGIFGVEPRRARLGLSPQQITQRGPEDDRVGLRIRLVGWQVEQIDHRPLNRAGHEQVREGAPKCLRAGSQPPGDGPAKVDARQHALLPVVSFPPQKYGSLALQVRVREQSTLRCGKRRHRSQEKRQGTRGLHRIHDVGHAQHDDHFLAGQAARSRRRLGARGRTPELDPPARNEEHRANLRDHVIPAGPTQADIRVISTKCVNN